MLNRSLRVSASIIAAAILGSLFVEAPAEAAKPQSAYYAADSDGIFWFMHISDTHVDTTSSTSEPQLKFALGEAAHVIDPIAVFLTGDIVDGSKTQWGLAVPTSGQEESEWQLYQTILYDMNAEDPNWLFDSPGNHDAYDDNGLKFYLQYGLQGRTTETALFADAVFTTKLGKYYFIATNAAGTYASPYSFGNPQFTHIDQMEKGFNANSDAELAFVFAHHHLVPHGDTGAQNALKLPGISIDDPPGNAAVALNLFEKVGAFYLHGHVHQYKESMQGGVVTVQIGSCNKNEAIDRSSDKAFAETKFKANIGIGIVDHNAFVYGFTDTKNPWPMVAITAPVDKYLKGGGMPGGKQVFVDYEGDLLEYGVQKNPYAYDVCLDRVDNPVRAVVLSSTSVTSVTLSIDGSEVGTLEKVVPSSEEEQEGVYATTMNTKGLNPGEHKLTVTAKSAGKTRTDTITVNFTPGPCEPLVEPDPEPEPEPSADAGSDGGSDNKPDGGTPDAPVDAEYDADDEEGVDDSSGCGCRVGGAADGGTYGGSYAGIAVLLGLGAIGLRRRRD
ncbi:MAG: metallophosphoesterase [Polyangiaceae bacterium]|nr:metallophosphoesterase [Polyangiaceae bacterium]